MLMYCVGIVHTHMQCTLLARPCSLDDINSLNDSAKKCVGDARHKFDDTIMMMMTISVMVSNWFWSAASSMLLI